MSFQQSIYSYIVKCRYSKERKENSKQKIKGEGYGKTILGRQALFVF